jgi:hypothetical protein
MWRRLGVVFVLLLAGTSLTFGPGYGGDGPSVKVPLDIDVYDQAGGEGKPRSGFLKGGSTVNFVKEEDHWCEVYGTAVPGNRGWIWCGKGDDGQNYQLTFLNAESNAAPVKSDCKEIGPNEEAAGGSSDPKAKYECEELGNGNRQCCWVKYP